MEKTIRKAKKEIADLKAKLKSAEAPGLSMEAKRLLILYAQGMTDWQRGDGRKPWRQNYQEALQEFSAELSRPEGCSSRTLYYLMFQTQFRGGEGTEKARRSEAEFWLLARQVALKATEELLSKNEARRNFLKFIDKVLAERDAPEKPASPPAPS